MNVPVGALLGLSAILFGIGVFGFLARRNIILMLIICSSKRKTRMKRHSKPTSPRIQRLNMSWRPRETRAGKSTSTTVTCSQGSRARCQAKARARSCEKPPSIMRSAYMVCLVLI